LLVITSDHGEGLSDHPGVDNAHGHGLVLYESQLRVPLILYHSKGALGSGVVIDQPVRIMDVFPTVADLLGFEVKRRVDGVSLEEAIANPGTEVDLPPFFVAETYFQEAKKQSVYSAGWNFYNNMDGWKGMDPTELQHARAPELGARSNRIAQHRDEAEKLGAFLRAWEHQHPKADPLDNGSLPDELIEQLRAIGYLD
jgi:arylsulfatase A-like enzyme